jgi:hypothetical protein
VAGGDTGVIEETGITTLAFTEWPRYVPMPREAVVISEEKGMNNAVMDGPGSATE